MSNKTLPIDSLSEYSPDYVFKYMKDRTHEKLIPLKAKITQFQKKNLPANQRINFSMNELAKNNVDALVKLEKYKCWLQKQNPQSQSQLQEMQQDTQVSNQRPFQLSQQDKIYIEHSVLKYIHKDDSGRKWKVNINPEIDYSYLTDNEVSQFLAMMYMFQNGYFPFVEGKIQSKSKIFIKYMDTLKKRPSQDIVTFKCPLGKDNWVIFSFMIERLQNQIYTICVDINQICKNLDLGKINSQIDKRFSLKKYKIVQGQIEFKYDKNMKIKPEQIFKFGDKSFHFCSNLTEKTRRIFPSKVDRSKIAPQINPQILTNQVFDCEIQILKDNTNYESIRYIYKELENNDYFSYNLSPSQYDVLETRGNLIVIGRSGTGKTTCALLRLFFKELNNTQKKQKNVFLTASPVLIAEINKKYNQIKQGIRQIHNYDYFNQNQVIFDERNQIRNFYNRLDEINEASMRQRIDSFLSNKIFPCFLTVNEYIQNLDAKIQNSFFSTRNLQREIGRNEEETILSYPDEIEWQQKIRRIRNIRLNHGQQGNQIEEQESTQIKFEQFAKQIYGLPEIKRLAGKLSPEIIWSEIYSIIKGSSRAHNFVGRCLNFKNYCEESQLKNQFLYLEDRKRIYEIFEHYDRILIETKKYDLLDLVNNILFQISRRQNHDLALTSLFIDQVQDLPPAFIFLAGKIVQQSLFFSGDTAQTIAKGVNFRFKDICQLFSQKYFQKSFKLQKPQIKQLGVNFRSKNQIIQLSNSLIKCLMMMFPKSIDKIPQEVSTQHGPKPVIMSSRDSQRLSQILRSQFGNLHNRNRNNLFGADKAIIVRNKSTKEKIPQQLSQMICLTYEQCKGLEYDVVILYDFFTQSPDVQWSYLKHIELQSRQNGVKQLGFDKNCLGTNIRMYFDLCTQLKILYTVITRPRTKLIICDDNIPEQLLRIWKFLDLVQDAQTFYRSQEAQLADNENRLNNNYNGNDGNQQKLIPNQEMNVLDHLNLNENRDRDQQNYQKYRKQWADQGFKFFFERKIYDQAVNCFRHAEIPELQQISKAFFFAKIAQNEAEIVQQRLQYYIRAGQIFNRYNRKYEAGKCFYLGRQYKKALTIFRELNIRKYQAQCYWKMKNYSLAEQIFFSEQKFLKCFNVLEQSEYWFLMLARLYEKPDGFGKVENKVIHKGLQGTMMNFLWEFSTWILNNWDRKNNLFQFKDYIHPILISRYEEQKYWKIDFFKDLHYLYLNEQKEFYFEHPEMRQNMEEVKCNFINRLVGINKNKFQVIDTFLTTIIYAVGQLNGFNLIDNFKKYSIENFGFTSQFYDQDYNIRVWVKSLQSVFNVLQTFDCHLFIAAFAKSLDLLKIQQLITIQNFLKIDLSKGLTQQVDYRINLHYQLIHQVSEKSLEEKLSLLLLVFGRLKDLRHMFQQEDVLISEYMGDYSNSLTNRQCEIVRFKLLKVPKEHQFYCFNDNYKKSNNSRTLHKAYQYYKIFELIDDMSPDQFFAKNQKQKQYIDYFKSLTNQQVIQLEQKQKLAVEQKLQELDKKIKRSQIDLKYSQQDKIKIYANTSKQQADAIEKKIKFMKLIPNYVWLPQQCQKKPQKAYQLKKTIQQIKKQRNKKLNEIDDKVNKKIQELKARVDVLKTIKQLKQKLKLNKKICEQEHKEYSKKNQQVKFLAEIVQSIQKYLQPKIEEIRQLQSQKKGNKNDKKLNYRIKTMNDNMKQQMSQLNQRKKDYEKAKIQFKKAQQKMQSLFAQNQQIDYQITLNKQYICKLNLGTIDKKTGELILQYSPEYTVTKIKQYVLRFQPTFKNQGEIEKNVIKDQYKKILKNVDEYLYFHQTVPEGCQNDRKKIVQKIENLNKDIQRLHKQKSEQKLRTQARVKVNFQSKCFRKHCLQYRKDFLKDQILKNDLLKENLDEEFIIVIQLLSRLSPAGTKIFRDEIKKNSSLLEEIISYNDGSLDKIFIIVHFLIHQRQLALLQNIVVKQSYQLFFQQMQRFLQNIKQQSQQMMLVKNTLAIFGINVIEALQNDDFNYLEGFSMIQSGHNFVKSLKSQFYHNISSTHILCRTTDIIDILVNFLISKIQQSPTIFRMFDIDQFFPKQIRQFKMRSQEFIQNEQKRLLDIIRKVVFNKDKEYLQTGEICHLKQNLSDLKLCYFTQMIQLQEKNDLNIEMKAQKITVILEKIIYLTKFIENINNIIEFNRNSLKRINGKENFINDKSLYQAKLHKENTVQRIKNLIDKFQVLKQQTQEQQFPKIDENRSPLRNRQHLQKLRYKNMRNNNRKKRRFQNSYQHEQQGSHYIVDQNHKQKIQYDLYLGRWVSQK